MGYRQECIGRMNQVKVQAGMQRRHLGNVDLIHAPYALYGVQYIDLVSVAPFQAGMQRRHLGN